MIDRRKGQWAFNESCRQVLALRARYPETEAIDVGMVRLDAHTEALKALADVQQTQPK